MSHHHKLTAMALCACLLGAEAAQAIPLSPVPPGAATQTAAQPVYYRGGYGNRGYGYRGYRRGYGAGIGLGIAGAVIGSAIIADRYGYGYSRYRYRGEGYSANQRCADTYRSYDPDSGTYLGYDGNRHTCPYL